MDGALPLLVQHAYGGNPAAGTAGADVDGNVVAELREELQQPLD